MSVVLDTGAWIALPVRAETPLRGGRRPPPACSTGCATIRQPGPVHVVFPTFSDIETPIASLTNSSGCHTLVQHRELGRSVNIGRIRKGRPLSSCALPELSPPLVRLWSLQRTRTSEEGSLCPQPLTATTRAKALKRADTRAATSGLGPTFPTNRSERPEADPTST